MTTVFNKSAAALNSLAEVLLQLPGNDTYAEPCTALSNATIGQHTRHIIELYQCLLEGYTPGAVNYDDRRRNSLYENDIHAAVNAIKEIQQTLDQPDKALTLVSMDENGTSNIQSNYYREILYNLEHCIHHQALIKVALLSIKDFPVTAGFGVAPSTLQYRQQCAQ